MSIHTKCELIVKEKKSWHRIFKAGKSQDPVYNIEKNNLFLHLKIHRLLQIIIKKNNTLKVYVFWFLNLY